MARHDEPVTAYRRLLIEALGEQTERRWREAPASLQFFVDHDCVGVVDCSSREVRFDCAERTRPIRLLEIRSESGLIVGSLAPRELGMTEQTFEGQRYRVAVMVRNEPEAASFSVAYHREGALTAGVRRLAGRVAVRAAALRHAVPAPTPAGLWPRVTAFAQVAVALSLILLVGERLVDRTRQDADLRATQQALSQLEHRLTVLADVDRQPPRLAESLRSIADEQRQLRAELARVQERVTRTGDSDMRVYAALQSAAADRDRLRDQLQQLAQAKQALTTAVLRLEQQALASAEKELKIAKTVTPQEPAKPEAPKVNEVALSQPTPPAQVAEAKADQPFTFYVSFQEGTSEKSIDELMQEIHGRRAPANAGWYSVEVDLPQPETRDQFLQSLRSTKIVKALTTSLKTEGEGAR